MLMQDPRAKPWVRQIADAFRGAFESEDPELSSENSEPVLESLELSQRYRDNLDTTDILLRIMEEPADSEARAFLLNRLDHATHTAVERRRYHEGINGSYLDQYISHGEPNPEATSSIAFDSVAQGPMLLIKELYNAAHSLYLAKPDETEIWKKGVAINLGQSDQFGNWSQAVHVDEIARHLTGIEVVKELGEEVEIIIHDRTHPHVSYEFERCGDHHGNWFAINVIRKRPVADIHIANQGFAETIHVFRHSSFLVSAHAERHNLLHWALRGAGPQTEEGHPGYDSVDAEVAQRFIHEFLAHTLASEQRAEQHLVLPVSSNYIARMRRPNTEVE